MICAEAKELLKSYVEGSADTAAREALEAHFATCEGCRLEAELTGAVHSPPSGELTLEPLSTMQSPPQIAPLGAEPPNAGPPPEALIPSSEGPADAEEEISFKDLVLEAPEATVTAAAPPAESLFDSLGPPSSGPTKATNAPKVGAQPGPLETQPAPAWGFEPVDPPRESTPPAESLNLAEQAHARKADAKAKGKVAALRVMLWAAGGLSGLALLGVSIWIALAFNRNPSPAPDSGASPRGAASADPNSSEGVAPPADATVDPSSGAGAAGGDQAPADNSGEQAAPAPDGSVQGTDANDPSDGRVIRAGSMAGAQGGPTDGIAPSNQTKPSTTGSGTRAKPGTRTPAPTGTKTAASTRSSGEAGGSSGETAPRTTSSSGSRKPIGPRPAADDLEPVGPDEAEIPFTTTTRPRATTPTPATSTPPPASSKPESGTSSSAPSPAPAPSGTGVTAAPEPAPTKPIDRLHLATVQAATAEDLEALRKLKVSWKAAIRTATSTDRARTKREYADCLWAIQELSGRTQDRREALAAYREYVLYAPAGANDSRTVGRMRFLEDVISESQ